MKVCISCKRIYVSERDYLKNTSSWRVASDGCLYFSCSCSSTIVLEAGSFAWFKPNKLMSEKAGSIFERLNDKESLPRVSAASSKLIQLLGQENSTTIEMVKVLKMDPVLAASILKAANGSRGFAEASVVQNLDQAINYIGRKPMGALVSGASLSSFKFKTKIFHQQHYWMEAYTCGYIAEALTRRYALHLSKDVSYLAGTLLNVGKCIGAIVLPDEIDRIFQKVSEEKLSWGLVERDLLCTDHCLLGEIAAVVWGLPKETLDGVLNHHLPLDTVRAPSKPSLQSICTFANQLQHLVLQQPSRIDDAILTSCEKVFKIAGEKGMLRLAEELAPIRNKVLSELKENAAA